MRAHRFMASNALTSQQIPRDRKDEKDTYQLANENTRIQAAVLPYARVFEWLHYCERESEIHILARAIPGDSLKYPQQLIIQVIIYI